MNRGRFHPPRACGSISQSELWLTARGIAVSLLTLTLIFAACARNESVQKSDPPSTIEIPAPQPPIEESQVERDSLSTEPHLLEGSGIAVWAKGFQGRFITGLDGALYESYREATIENVQRMLKDRGLYAGPINGILDRPTMRSIFAFQEANEILQRCGIPTPHTRKMLKQGSHTDLSS